MREGLQKVVATDDTIVAAATPFGRSALGVLRVSGNNAESIARALFESSSTLEHRKATVGRWRAPSGDEWIDQVVVVFFRAPHSYTGEPLLEISAHGNPVILNRILRSIQAAGARIAMPGEFTLRAVAHGKMDLIQAEGVRDFIEAQTEGQARIALRQLEGALSKRVRPIKDRLIDIIAHLEAGIDFVEDEIDAPDPRAHLKTVDDLMRQLAALQATFSYGRLLNEGLRLAIVGKPNVGKSSLFNRLLASDRAIVTDIPGTTRDVLTETISIDGVPLRFCDTAGIRQTTDVVESLGVARTVDALSEADLAMVVIDGSRALEQTDLEVLSMARDIPRIVVVNKSDLPRCVDVNCLESPNWVSFSATTGEGQESLEAAVRRFIESRRNDADTDVVLTNDRQGAAVASAIEGLTCAARAINAGTPHEMVLLDFYGALAGLDELTGEVVTDDILGRIFSTFCIGK